MCRALALSIYDAVTTVVWTVRLMQKTANRFCDDLSNRHIGISSLNSTYGQVDLDWSIAVQRDYMLSVVGVCVIALGHLATFCWSACIWARAQVNRPAETRPRQRAGRFCCGLTFKDVANPLFAVTLSAAAAGGVVVSMIVAYANPYRYARCQGDATRDLQTWVPIFVLAAALAMPVVVTMAMLCGTQAHYNLEEDVRRHGPRQLRRKFARASCCLWRAFFCNRRRRINIGAQQPPDAAQSRAATQPVNCTGCPAADEGDLIWYKWLAIPCIFVTFPASLVWSAGLGLAWVWFCFGTAASLSNGDSAIEVMEMLNVVPEWQRNKPAAVVSLWTALTGLFSSTPAPAGDAAAAAGNTSTQNLGATAQLNSAAPEKSNSGRYRRTGELLLLVQ